MPFDAGEGAGRKHLSLPLSASVPQQQFVAVCHATKTWYGPNILRVNAVMGHASQGLAVACVMVTFVKSSVPVVDNV